MHPYLRLHLQVRPAAGRGSAVPVLPAALVRRVLGKAFIDTFCPFGEPRCQGAEAGSEPRPRPQDLCHLAECCPYGVLFAASRSARPPFALYTSGNEEERAILEVTLLGSGWRLYPWVLSGLAQAFRLGLGSERTEWILETVDRIRPDRRRERLCGADLTQLSPTLEPDWLGFGIEPFLAPQPVEIRLLSPARLLQGGRLLPRNAPVPFALLIARILDRFQGLYGESSSEILHPAIRPTVEAEASRVPLLVNETEWIEVKDYSARSGAEMLLGGKIGRLVYGPGAARFFPILQAGEILHLGKNPTAGCGRIEVRLPEGGEGSSTK
jgi:CRISPR-associated endoribonuclease Cas6